MSEEVVGTRDSDPCNPLDDAILSGGLYVSAAQSILARARNPNADKASESGAAVYQSDVGSSRRHKLPKSEPPPADDDFLEDVCLRDDIDEEVDEITDVLSKGTGATEKRSGHPEEHVVRSATWQTPDIDILDSVQGKTKQFSFPTARCGHTMVHMRDPRNLLVVFGGLSIAGGADHDGAAFQPYVTVLLKSEKGGVVYHNDIYLYHTIRRTWWKVRTEHGTPSPSGRCGHCAVALDKEYVWVFGGRVAHGLVSNEVYLFNVLTQKWTFKSGGVATGIAASATHGDEYDAFYATEPSPRYDSAAATVGNSRVLMFGGRDLQLLYSDLWSWDLASGAWTPITTVGTKPQPRFGHALVAVSNNREVLVFGGNFVAPGAEIGTSPEVLELERMIALAAQTLSRCYQFEKVEAAVSGAALVETAEGMDDKEIARVGAQISARVAQREKATQLAADHLMKLQKRRELEVARVRKLAVHPYKTLDVHVLDVKNMAWSLPDLPRVRGEAPCARHHFATGRVGSNRLVVWGGASCCAEAPEKGLSDIYMLNLKSRLWSKIPVENSTDETATLLRVVQLELRRANRMLSSAADLARSKSLRNDECIEFLEARARVKVCKWRVQEVEIQCKGSTALPSIRCEAAHTSLGYRIAILGGVCRSGKCSENHHTTDEFLMLDFEPPDEYRRRLDDEFHARLEMERSKRELADLKRRLVEEYKRRKFLEAERKREAEERARMDIEDRLSSYPPKTRPPPVRVLARSPNTIWFEWDATEVDAWNQAIPREQVSYVLSLVGGYCKFAVGDPCRVLYVDRLDKSDPNEGAESSGMQTAAEWLSAYSHGEETALKLEHSLSVVEGSSRALGVGDGCSTTDGVMTDALSTGDEGFGSPWPANSIEAMGSPARITSVHVDGSIDVRYSDGGKERRIPRWRVFRRLMPLPRIVYVGQETRYAATGLVPDNVINHVPGYTVYVRAIVQTLGTEHPTEEPSLYSDVILAETAWPSTQPCAGVLEEEVESLKSSDVQESGSVGSSSRTRTKGSKMPVIVASQGEGLDVI